MYFVVGVGAKQDAGLAVLIRTLAKEMQRGIWIEVQRFLAFFGSDGISLIDAFLQALVKLPKDGFVIRLMAVCDWFYHNFSVALGYIY
jgi:hypothetical protein